MRIFLILLGSVLLADTIFVSLRSNGHLGTWLPAILGLPLLLIGIFLPQLAGWFAHGFGAVVKWALVCLYSLCTIFFAVMAAVINNAPAPVHQDADVLIVLGCSIRGERVSLTLKHRLDTAADYLEAHPKTIAVVSGGKGPGEHVTEAFAMNKYLVERGIPQSRILMEDQSTSTLENFLFSRRLIEQQLGSNLEIAFVTTRFHVMRAERTAKSQGVDAFGIGAPGVWYVAPNDYLRESLAIAYYWIAGRL